MYIVLIVSSVQFGTLCLDPYGGYVGDGRNVALWSGCMADKRKFLFSNIGKY